MNSDDLKNAFLKHIKWLFPRKAFVTIVWASGMYFWTGVAGNSAGL